jgi:DNA-directed RNA polymerase sigma subunit (sigma70/sigma32)
MVELLFSLEDTCALDVADRGVPLTLDEIGKLFLFSRERTRQLIGADTGPHEQRSPICKLRRLAKFKPELKELMAFWEDQSDRDRYQESTPKGEMY